jgi:hypothetical protein
VKFFNTEGGIRGILASQKSRIMGKTLDAISFNSTRSTGKN